MSKAFTKEESGAEDSEEERESSPALPVGFKNYMTPGGAAKLKAELKKLLDVDRPEVVRTVAWAASNGDRSENGDYIYGKRRLREIDRRIRFLQKRLDSAQVVDPVMQKGDRVLFGATVVIQGEEGRQKTFQIVGIDEAEVSRGRISWISPLAKALLNAKQGDVIPFRSPKGEEDLEIVSVAYQVIGE